MAVTMSSASPPTSPDGRHTTAEATATRALAMQHPISSQSWRQRATRVTRYGGSLVSSFDAPHFQTPFFLWAIVLSSWFGGFGPGVVASILSILAVRFYFSSPHVLE